MIRRRASLSLALVVTAFAASCGTSSSATGTGGATTSSAASTSSSPDTTSTTTATSSATASSATSSAVSTSASTSGAGGAGAEPSCATTGKNLLLCEDFEGIALGGVPDPGTWSLDKGAGATVGVDDQQFRHGKHALHLHTLPADNRALLHATKIFPLPNGMNTIYGRANFMFGAGLTVPKDHTNFFEASGPVNGQSGNYRYGAANAKLFANYNPGDPGESSKTDVPVGTWSCFEWAFIGDTNEMHFWIDGKEIMDLAVPPGGVNGMVWTAPKFNSLYVGWITFAQDTSSDHYDIWYDDIAIDVARIGCAI